MGRVREFEETDIPSVAALHRRVFPARNGSEAPAAAYHAYFREIFLANPWRSAEPTSLVFEDSGEIVGFLGVIRRQMMLHGRPISMATSSQFIVEPSRRATLAGIELIRGLLAGPQDLTVADEAIDLSRRLWEGLGGATVPLYSLSWVQVLRPFAFAANRWAAGRPAARALVPAARLADIVVSHVPGNPFQAPAATTQAEELDGDTLAACLADLMRDRALRPAYDGEAAAWLLAVLIRKPGIGIVRKTLVRKADGAVAGWYVYAGSREGIGEVIQLGAADDSIGVVLDHLFAQGRRDGMVALVGRLDPRHVGALAARWCFFHHRGYWTLVHARDPELIQIIQRGDAFLTRLEGEWCIRFRVG